MQPDGMRVDSIDGSIKLSDQEDSDSLDEAPLALIGQHVARRNLEPPPAAPAPPSLSPISLGQSLTVAHDYPNLQQPAESLTCAAMQPATQQPPALHTGRITRASLRKVSSSLSPSPPPPGLVNDAADALGSIPVVSSSSDGADLRVSTRNSGRLARKRAQADTDVKVHQSSKHASGSSEGTVKKMRTEENMSSNVSTNMSSLSARINAHPQAILDKNDIIGGLEAFKLIESLETFPSMKGSLLAGLPGYRGSITDAAPSDISATLEGEVSPNGPLPQASVTTFGGHKVTRLAQAPSSQLPPRPSSVQVAHSSLFSPVFPPRRSHSSRQLNEDGGADVVAQTEPHADRELDADLTAKSDREMKKAAFMMGSGQSLGASISYNVSQASLTPAPALPLDSFHTRCLPPVDSWSGLIEAGIRRAQGSSWQQIREALPPTVLAVSSFSEVNQQYLKSSLASSVGSCDAASAIARINNLFSGWTYRALCSQMDSRPPPVASPRPLFIAQSQKERTPPVGHSNPPESMDPWLSSSRDGVAPTAAATDPTTGVYKQKHTTRQFARGRAPPPRAASPDKTDPLPGTSSVPVLPPASVQIPPALAPSVLGQKSGDLPPGFNRGFIFNYSQATMMQVNIFHITVAESLNAIKGHMPTQLD